MRPLRASLGGATRLLISPDGELNLVPFEALVDEHGRYLIERYAISYLTSGRDLLRMQVPRAEPRPPGDRRGSAVRRAAAARSAAVRQRVGPTPRRSVTDGDDAVDDVFRAAGRRRAEEARAIKALFPGSDAAHGPRATKATLQQVEAPRMLHIASHGFFLPGRRARQRSRESAAALRPGAGRREPDARLARRRHSHGARSVQPESVGHEAGDALGVRHRRRRGPQRRRRLRPAPRVRAGRRRDAGDEPVAGQRLHRARDDGRRTTPACGRASGAATRCGRRSSRC